MIKFSEEVILGPINSTFFCELFTLKLNYNPYDCTFKATLNGNPLDNQQIVQILPQLC